MAKRTTILVILIIILICNVDYSDGKCPSINYIISGKIITETKNKIEGVTVAVFLDKDTIGDFTKTDKNGDFQVRSPFYTFNGWLFFESCGKEANKIEIVIIKEGYLAKKLVFDIKDIELIEGHIINCPPIKIEKN